MMIARFALLLVFSAVLVADEPCSKTKCTLPCCQCPVSNGNPTSFNVTELPQLVMLTFVGNLNPETLDPIRAILNPAHRNPNKCPISSTFFVNDNYTDYCFVQRLFDNHNEIAMTTSSNRCPLTNCYEENHWRRWTLSDWQREVKQQRLNIIDQAHIHQSHVKGFRVPHLQIDQNQHLELLRHFHFHYDSSMLFQASSLLWPFTMNYPWNQSDCLNCDEPIKPIESLWQIPLHEWTYPDASQSCRTLSDASCLPDDKPYSGDLLFELLKYNFDRHVTDHRTPFVIELDLFWLSEKKDIRLEALIRFIDYILHSDEYGYAYFVSIEQALEWLKYPRPLSELQDFWAFGCKDTLYEYDIDCSHDGSKGEKNFIASNEDAQRLLAANKSNSSDDAPPMDRRAEELFRSGIVVHSIWVFLLLIITVLFYDKYFATK